MKFLVAWISLMGVVSATLKAEPAKLLEKENIVETAAVHGVWQPGRKDQDLAVNDRVRTGDLSRAAVQLSDKSVVRMNQRTSLTILPPDQVSSKGGIDLLGGAAYFLSREKPEELRIRTPSANGITRGTEFQLAVAPNGKTTLTMFEGEVELANAHGRLLLRSGEQGEAEVGRAPRKTAVLYARNIIQWALYYPGVIDPVDLTLGHQEEAAIAPSLQAYRQGDLLGALEKYPKAHQPVSSAGKLYRAAVLLAVGRVDEAGRELQAVPASNASRQALEEVVAAVKFEDWSSTQPPRTVGEWLAKSYYCQSKSQLDEAREAARKATELAPTFGYAWERLAELEFSFGHTGATGRALERGLELAPRNAQAHALRGFVLSANNSMGRAREAFQEAIDLDGALGNAWLGRGLTYFRQGQPEPGRRDLQTAAAMEGNRSIFHSYLGKAFSQTGEAKEARRDLQVAKDLDAHDPTPWLYSAIQNKSENRYNAAVTDLEKSLELNENRRVYRSQFLLDQDRAVRSTNLAAIYLNEGMEDVSVREAVRAVDSDYGSASAHLFLSNSYNALRDPRRILLRYETAWFNELLLSNLLAPVGGGSLSQYVSQQEYSKLFESDGLGISSLTDYFSTGELRTTNSQYGTVGNLSYALDGEYLYDNGNRPNNRISRFEGYATFKLQLGPQDTVFFKTKYEDLENGDIFQRYDPGEVGRETITKSIDPATGKLMKVVHRNVSALTFDFHERQEPGLLLLGFHHEWNPGIHSLLLFGRLANSQVLTADQTNQLVVTRDISTLFPAHFPVEGPASLHSLANPLFVRTLSDLREKGSVTAVASLPLNSAYRASFEILSGEFNQIVTVGPDTTVLGARYQKGTFDTQHVFSGLDAFLSSSGLFFNPPEDASTSVGFERVNLYAYNTLKVAPWLSLTGGLTWDKLRYPDNFRSPPINDRQDVLDRFSPKAGFILTPTSTTTLRGAFTEGISGASFDESVRLEPTQVAGFTQAYRTIAPENLVGSVAGARFTTYGLSLEQKLPTRTYLGVQVDRLEQRLDRTIGVFDAFSNLGNLEGVLPSSTGEKLNYGEDILTASINQLLGEEWSLGARYRYSRSELREQFGSFSNLLLPNADRTRVSGLHEVSLFALYNHPSGLFARVEGDWYRQVNDTFTPGQLQPRTDPNPGDSFWQLDAYAGWRFYRNQCELSLGVLNLLDRDYHLDPLNYYLELPRQRTAVLRLKFTF